MLGSFADLPNMPEISMIELGCAPGDILRLLHQARPQHQLWGIDYSQQGIEIARQRLSDRGIEATLIHADIMEYQPPHPFDLVLSCGLIEHFREPSYILQCHRKFVRPGGWIAVTVPNYSQPFVNQCLRRFSPETLRIHNVRMMNTAALRDAMQQVGLQNIRTGYAGGPKLPGPTLPPTLSSRLYKAFSRSWNFTSGFLPENMLWGNIVWAVGSYQG